MMKSLPLILFFVLWSFSAIIAQDFNNAGGFRLGKTDGVNYKRFLNEKQAVEIFLGFGGYDKGMQLYVLHEWHQNLRFNFTDNLYLYYGVGGHVGYVRPYEERLYYTSEGQPFVDYGKNTYYALGVDGIVGLEYRIYTVPMTVGVDLKPYVEYVGFQYTQFQFWDFAINLKYIF